MNIVSHMTEIEMHVLAMLACRQSIKYTARCLGLSPRQVQYYHSTLRIKFAASDHQALTDLVQMHPELDALTVMGQHLMVAYEMGSVQRRLAASQQD